MAAAPSTGAGADTPAIEGPVHDIASTAEPILRMLPEWFGVPAAVRGYLREMKTQPSWIAREADQVVGFLTLKQHFDQAAEILIMAVPPPPMARASDARCWAASNATSPNNAPASCRLKHSAPATPIPITPRPGNSMKRPASSRWKKSPPSGIRPTPA